MENAYKYAGKGARVVVTVTRSGDEAILLVADNGPGIPADKRMDVLERFVRLDSARSTPGNGLGLSLVKAVAMLHEAMLTLEDNSPGLRVRLRFKLCADETQCIPEERSF